MSDAAHSSASGRYALGCGLGVGIAAVALAVVFLGGHFAIRDHTPEIAEKMGRIAGGFLFPIMRSRSTDIDVVTRIFGYMYRDAFIIVTVAAINDTSLERIAFGARALPDSVTRTP